MNNQSLPTKVYALLARFSYQEFFKNPAVLLGTQFISYVYNGLTKLDTALLKYNSPVYNVCPLLTREYKNGRKEVVKNKHHQVFEKWNSLVSTVHFSPAYSTT
jgi:hypothetical protein